MQDCEISLILLLTGLFSFAMKTRYYISTGSKTNFYTLRYSFDEATSRSVGDGLPPEIGVVTRDYHVRNLSIDRAEAVAKAREITGKDLDADFDVLPIGERRDSVISRALATASALSIERLRTW